MATPHNTAEKGDIAKTVIMPGDPLRAKFIAENYFSDVKCFNEVRGMLGFTGKYKGKEISVMGHGMGMPSVSIYSHELYQFYDVDNIIRTGSAGALQDYLKIKDIVIAIGAHTDSNIAYQYGLHGSFNPSASFDILEKAVNVARDKGLRFHVGDIMSTDIFYNKSRDCDIYKELGTLAIEMETAALYMNAAEAGKKALSILTISDHIYSNEELDAAERQSGMVDMIELALETAYLL